MKFRYMAGVIATLFAGHAFALGTATAKVQDISGSCGSGDNQQSCTYQQIVTVAITPDSADIGLPGAFYIGVMRDGVDLAFYQNGTWNPPSTANGQSNAYAPTEVLTAIPGGNRTYTVLSNKMICDVVGIGSKVVMYAGYGVLTPQSEKLVTSYHATANPLVPPDHIRNTYIRMDMQSNKKYWNVLNYDCTNYVIGQGSESQNQNNSGYVGGH